MAGKAERRTRAAVMPLDTGSFTYATLWARVGRELHGGQWTVRRDGNRWRVYPPGGTHRRDTPAVTVGEKASSTP